MAERRMFSKTIIGSDKFLDMSRAAQCLYFMLGVYADDDGFIGNIKHIFYQNGFLKGDLDELQKNDYIIIFETGIIAIKHWRINNSLRGDRYTPTLYVNEFNRLLIKNNMYVFKSMQDDSSDNKPTGIPTGKPSGAHSRVEESIGSKDKNNKGDDNTLDEKQQKSLSPSNDIDGDTDIDLFNSLDASGLFTDKEIQQIVDAFSCSTWLRKNITSPQKIAKLKSKIISGYYRDYAELSNDRNQDIITADMDCSKYAAMGFKIITDND